MAPRKSAHEDRDVEKDTEKDAEEAPYGVAFSPEGVAWQPPSRMPEEAEDS
jgi:hypothetical protein